MKEAEKIAKEYFISNGFECIKIPETTKKTPDFGIYKDGILIAICEVKAIDFDHKWMNQCTIGWQVQKRKEPFPNRISDDIHTAYKQFYCYDQEHFYPRILFFVNYDNNCNSMDLTQVITGNFYATDGTIHPLYKRISEGRIINEKVDIDLYIWAKGKKDNVWSISIDPENDTEEDTMLSCMTPRGNVIKELLS